jgi:hypothetical protein
MTDQAMIREFLAGRRLAVVGASADPKSFGGTIWRELRKRGYDAVAVNPSCEGIDGEPCYRDLASVPGDLDGVIVMVHRDRAAAVVRESAARGVARVWLFKGLGGAGAVSDDAVAAARARGVDVVAGACPMMFLEPVGWFHRVHRALHRDRAA